MIIRWWLILGFVLVVGAWILQVPLAPEPFQATARSAIEGYRKAGLMPPAGTTKLSKEVGHDVFEIPKSDARHAREAAAAGGGTSMPGMKPMPGMKKGAKEAGHGKAEMKPMPGMKKGAKETGHGKAEMKPMPGMKKGAKKDGEAHGKEPPGGHGGGGKAVGITVLAKGSRSEVAKALGSTKVTRTVKIEIMEWGFRPGRIEVKPGQVIRLVIRNAGRMPHEFMFMSMAGMRAVNYRLERADWNLLEHEAIVEQSIVMPGDSFEQVVRIEKPGVWMFMCMFPYHMQFGMMGAMATPGMGGMMGMKGMKMGGGMTGKPAMSGMKKDGEMKPMPGMKKGGEMKPMPGMKKTDH